MGLYFWQTLQNCHKHGAACEERRQNLGVDLLIEVRHRARADARAPEGFRDVLDTPRTEMPAKYISISASSTELS